MVSRLLVKYRYDTHQCTCIRGSNETAGRVEQVSVLISVIKLCETHQYNYAFLLLTADTKVPVMEITGHSQRPEGEYLDEQKSLHEHDLTEELRQEG